MTYNNSGSIVPYHDPHDNPFEYLNYINNDTTPSLANLSLINEQPTNPMVHPCVSIPIPIVNEVAPIGGDCVVDQLDDPMLWVLFDDGSSNGAGFVGDEAGPSNFLSNCNNNGYQEQPSNEEASTNRVEEGNMAHDGESLANGGKPLPVWPPEPISFGCSCCLVLREIIHCNGSFTCTTKLEIHGRIGMICHAILEIRDQAKSDPAAPEYYMFDFCKRSMENVGQFLRQYCDDRRTVGFMMMQDPFSIFYQALCVGIDTDVNVNNHYSYDSCPTYPGEVQVGEMGHVAGAMFMEGENRNGSGGTTRTDLSLQRERTKTMTLRDVAGYFHLPEEEACKKMKLCPTVLKKICRRDGLRRWPHRKIKSLEAKQLKLQDGSLSAEKRAKEVADIQRLKEEIAHIITVNDADENDAAV